MRILVMLDRSRPLGDQVYLQLREAVLGGTLRPGDRLPATRQLAASLHIARNTVAAAYARLRMEGYVTGMRSRGTRVSGDLPRSAFRPPSERSPAASRSPRAGGRRPGGPSPRIRISRYGRRVLARPDIFPPAVRTDRSRLDIDFDYNVNLSDAASRRAWSRLLRRASARHEIAAPRYDFRRGPEPLQAALARHLRLTRGVIAQPEQIIVTAAYQGAFHLAARVLMNPGDGVVIEDPQAIRVRHAFLTAGMRLHAVGGDASGMRTDRLPRPGRTRGTAGGIRLAYTSASCGWVTGAMLPLARRLALLEWARRSDAWIIENDHNSEYVYHGTPVQSLQGLDQDGRVIYVGTLSRLLAPDPLIGFLVVPERLVEAFAAAALVEGHYASPLDREVLARFIDSGEMEALLRRATRRLRERRHALLEALASLDGVTVSVHDAQGGLHLHATLPRVAAADLDLLVASAARAGIGVFPDRPYYIRAPRVPGLLLGFAGLDARSIAGGVARLGALIASFERRRGVGRPGA